MLPYKCAQFFCQLNCDLYSDVKERGTVQGRFLAIPVAVASELTKLTAYIAELVESLALTIINLVGAVFEAENCSLKDAGESFYSIIHSLKKIAISPLDMPLSAASVSLGLLANPETGFTERKESFSEQLRELKDLEAQNVGRFEYAFVKGF